MTTLARLTLDPKATIRSRISMRNLSGERHALDPIPNVTLVTVIRLSKSFEIEVIRLALACSSFTLVEKRRIYSSFQ